jgi:hypothetical protein
METKILQWLKIIILLVVGVCVSFMAYIFFFKPDSASIDIMKEHFKAVIGIPAAYLASLFLVLLLKQKEKPIEFRGLSFEFKGASGEIILWVFSFLSIVYAIGKLY